MSDEQLQSHGIAALFEMLIKHHNDKQIHRLISKVIQTGLLQLAINAAHSDNYLQSVLDWSLSHLIKLNEYRRFSSAYY